MSDPSSRLFSALTSVLVFSSLAFAACDSSSGENGEDVASGTTELRLGITHTQYTADSWNDPQAVSRARRWLEDRSFLQNQHIMGWGALSPEPAPGVYDWSTLDARVELMRETGGEAVITLCCAPDWMKGGTPGNTDWSRLEDAPDRAHFGDFAALSATVAARYPDVRYFQVWNEMKGFYHAPRNRWNYEAYTDLYNAVWDSVKAVRPDAKIGGPYVVMESWSSRDRMSHPSSVSGSWGVLDQRPLDVVAYWLENKKGADFVTVDLGTGTRDAGLTTDPFTATRKYADVANWLSDQTDLPVWIAEWYVSTGEEGDRALQTAVMSRALIEMAASGVNVALQWGPQSDGDRCIGGCLWTDTRQPSGGSTTALADVFEAFEVAFGPGTPLVDPGPVEGDASVLASPDHILIVNQRDAEQQVEVLGERVTLDAYEVRLVPRG